MIKVTLEFDSVEDMIGHFTETSISVGVPQPDTPPEVVGSPEPTPDHPVARVIDSDGMPWNPKIHSDAKSVNKDGTWKSRRGMAAEAKQAREEFKASGGNITPPADLPAAAPAAAPAAPAAAPAAPAAAPAAPAVPSVNPTPDVEGVMTMLTDMFTSGKITADTLGGIYERAGITDISNPTPELTNNPAIRAAIHAELLTIQ